MLVIPAPNKEAKELELIVADGILPTHGMKPITRLFHCSVQSSTRDTSMQWSVDIVDILG